MLEEVLKVFLSLFVIMGPFASIPVFLSVTKGMKEGQRARAASYAVGIAAIVLFAFLFFGQAILSLFRIDFQSLKIAGGIVLSILGVELVLGFSFTRKRYEHSPAIVLVGTPLLTGPGVIVTTVIFVQEYNTVLGAPAGYIITTIAAVAALALSWLTLWCSRYFVKLLGNYGVEITSRVTGILLVAVAVEFVATGVKAII